MSNWSSSWGDTANIGVDWGDVRYYSIKNNANNYEQVECFTVGNLAVHKAINVDEKGWRVTHIPTLAKCNKIVPYGLHTKQGLMNWCKKVQELYPEDWKILNKLTEADYNAEDLTDEVLDAKERLIKNCRKVKVE